MTLQVAVVAVIGSTVLGSLLGLGLARLRFRGSGATETLLLLPMVTPEIIMGISLLIFFAQLFSRTGRSARSRSPTSRSASRTWRSSSGPGRWAWTPSWRRPPATWARRALGAFWHVTLPIIAPAVAAGAMLAFALSFDDLVVTSFNAGVGSTTLPIFIYSAIKFGVSPQINAISTIIVAVVAIALFVAWRLGAFRGVGTPALWRRTTPNRDRSRSCGVSAPAASQPASTSGSSPCSRRKRQLLDPVVQLARVMTAVSASVRSVLGPA